MEIFTTQARLENLDSVNDFIHAQLESFSIPVKTLNMLDLAVEELYANICHYAYPPITGIVEIASEVTENPLKIKIRFSDEGIPFDPLKREDPDITATAENRKVGGLGIFLTKKTMDSVVYKHEDGKNILTIEKTLLEGKA